MINRLILTIATLSLASCAQSTIKETPLVHIGLGSCINQYETEAVLEQILASPPELFLFMGDNVYGDVSTAELTELREAYQAASQNSSYSRLRSIVPHMATWDDHDYGQNDGGADFPHRESTELLFHEFWETAEDDPRLARDGIYYSRNFGPVGQRVQVIMLDTRSFRSAWLPLAEGAQDTFHRYAPDDDPARTMLGDDQWEWLEDRLREPAELRLVVSSIQVMAEGHALERWGNFPAERQRLYDLISRTGAKGVVLLSGDQHVAGFYETTEGVPYRLVEFSSSSMGIPFKGERPEPDSARIGDLFTATNFGRITIDWSEPSVRLEIVGETGEVEDSLALGAFRLSGL